MPSSINSTSSSPGGIITTGATDNELVIQTGDTTAISIDASQNVTVAGDLTVNGTLVGGGDVVGPASATDNAVARFDGTTGKLIQNSGVAIDDSNNVTGIANLSFNSGYGSSAVAYGVRAWVNFDGTGTVGIRGSGNVSSITDNGTGLYTVNFTNTMPADYCVQISGVRADNSNTIITYSITNFPSSSTSGVQVRCVNTSFGAADAEYYFVTIYR